MNEYIGKNNVIKTIDDIVKYSHDCGFPEGLYQL